MQPCFLPPTLYPNAWLPPAWDHGTLDNWSPLIANEDQMIVIVHGRPFDPGVLGNMIALPPPGGRLPGAWPRLVTRGGTSHIRLANWNYRTHPSDNPDSASIPDALDPAYGIEVNIGSLDLLGGSEFSVGAIGVKNGSREYDAFKTYSWGNRPVDILAGNPQWPLSRFKTVLRGIFTSLGGDTSTIVLGIRTIQAKLENLIERSYYAGTGGLEGPLTFKGRVKPEVWGRRRKVPMLLINKDQQIWQVAVKLGAVLGVFDIGLPVSYSGNDYVSYEALSAAAVADGYYSTCITHGLIKFGRPVVKPVADVDGPAEIGYTAPAIIRYLVENRLTFAYNLSGDEVESVSFAKAESARGWTVGVWLDGETTATTVIDRLMRSIGGWAVPNRLGQLTLGLYKLPSNPLITLTESDIDDSDISLEARRPAVRRLVVGVRPTTAVHSAGEISAAATEEQRLAVAEQYRYVARTASVSDADAITHVIDTDLDDEDDADQLLAELLPLLSTATHLYSIPLRGLPFRHWVGDVRGLRHSRFGYSNGAAGMVLGIRESSSGDNRLRWLGPAGRMVNG